MPKLMTGASVVVGAAVWFLLFVILGVGLGTAFIAGGSVLAAGVLAAAIVAGGPVFDAPLTSAGLLLGIATFVVLEVVLSSIPMWVAVVSGLGVIGLYGLVNATVGSRSATTQTEPDVDAARDSSRPVPDRSYGNGHRSNGRELAGTR